MDSARSRSLYLCASILVSVWALPAAGADVYKWVDAQGKVHYSDRPGTVDAQRVPLQATPRPDPDAAARRAKERRLLRVFDEERQERRATEAKAMKAREERQRKCAQAKQRQFNYEHAHYLYEKGEDGSRHILSDPEHRRALLQVAAAVKHWCQSP